MPWLYYLDETADEVLDDGGITTIFTFPDTPLNLKVDMITNLRTTNLPAPCSAVTVM